MPLRRAANPLSVQHIWDAVRSIIYHHQMVDSKRIIKYLQKIDNCTTTQAELYLQQTIQDGLIVALPKVTGKGEHVDTFKIPTQDLPHMDDKDWYCFECHLGGDVVACRQCFRVYHTNCIENGQKRFDEFKKILKNNRQFNESSSNISTTDLDSDSLNSSLLLNNNELLTTNDTTNVTQNLSQTQYNHDLCSVCNISGISNDYHDKSELNYLLKFVLRRIQSWLPSIITHKMGAEERPEWLTDKELIWRSNQFFYQHKDMSIVETNLNNEFYKNLHEFLADILTIQHNVAIFHGIESQEFGAAELMIRDCLYDLAEIYTCPDCYRHSNEKINMKWFCLPCRIPHRLVWAKQKGYPYWPAKIIRETTTQYDVRFFGGKYERSLLNKAFVKSIDTPKEKLQIKSSSAFNKSVEELRFHQKLLEDPIELQKLIDSSKQQQQQQQKNSNRAANKSRNSSLTTKSTKTPSNKSLNNTYNNLTNNNKQECDDIYQFEDDTTTTTTATTPTTFTQSTPLSYQRSKRKNLDSNTINKRRFSTNSKKSTDNNIIHISSDGEDEFSFRQNYTTESLDFNGTYDQCDNNQSNGMQKLDHPYSDSVEKMRRKLELLDDKNDIIRCAMDCMQNEIDHITNEHNEHLKRLFEAHNAQISETKKKQWCYNCEQDAIYHCCWNTAYCSQSCQQQHWQAEHKKVCRRKR